MAKATSPKRDDRLYDPTRFVKLANVPDFERIPTGMAAFDTYTCGGFPVGTISLLSGPAGTGKTNFAICGIIGFQQRYPTARALYLNADNKVDTPWALQLGVDGERVEVFSPDSADQAHDVTYHLCQKHKEIGYVLVDSLAALSPEGEAIGEDDIGTAAKMNNKFFRKMTALQLIRMREGHPLTFVVINQERVKVGGKFPVPILPGGKQQEFQAALWLKFTAADAHVHPKLGIPLAITMHYHFKKNQGGANNYPGETRMAITPHGKWRPGQMIDHEFVWIWGTYLGLMKSRGNLGVEYNHQTWVKPALIAHWEDDPEAYRAAKRDLLATFKEWKKGKIDAHFAKEDVTLLTVGGTGEVQLARS